MSVEQMPVTAEVAFEMYSRHMRVLAEVMQPQSGVGRDGRFAQAAKTAEAWKLFLAAWANDTALAPYRSRYIPDAEILAAWSEFSEDYRVNDPESPMTKRMEEADTLFRLARPQSADGCAAVLRRSLVGLTRDDTARRAALDLYPLDAEDLDVPGPERALLRVIERLEGLTP